METRANYVLIGGFLASEDLGPVSAIFLREYDKSVLLRNSLRKERDLQLTRDDADYALSELMAQTETQSFNRAGTLFYLTTITRASALPDRKTDLYDALKAEGYASSKSLSAYLDRAASLWPQVAVLDVVDDAPPVVLRGTKIHVTATVALAGLAPEEVRVECFRGPLTSKGEIRSPERIEMEPLAAEPGPGAGAWKFAAVANGTLTGQIGYSIRVLPKHPALGDRFVPGLVRWA